MSDYKIGPFTIHDTDNNGKFSPNERISYLVGEKLVQDKAKAGQLCTSLKDNEQRSCRNDLQSILDLLALPYSPKVPSLWGSALKRLSNLSEAQYLFEDLQKYNANIQQKNFTEAWNILKGLDQNYRFVGTDVKKIFDRETIVLEKILFNKAEDAASQSKGAEADHWILFTEEISRYRGQKYDESKATAILNRVPYYTKQFELSRRAEPYVRQGDVTQVESIVKNMIGIATADGIKVDVRMESLLKRTQQYKNVKETLTKGLLPKRANENDNSYNERILPFYSEGTVERSQLEDIYYDEDGGANALIIDYYFKKSEDAFKRAEQSFQNLKDSDELLRDKGSFRDLRDSFYEAVINYGVLQGDDIKRRYTKQLGSQLNNFSKKAAARIIQLAQQGLVQCRNDKDADCRDQFQSKINSYQRVFWKEDPVPAFIEGN
jgi:hypothetical protein